MQRKCFENMFIRFNWLIASYKLIKFEESMIFRKIFLKKYGKVKVHFEHFANIENVKLDI